MEDYGTLSNTVLCIMLNRALGNQTIAEKRIFHVAGYQYARFSVLLDMLGAEHSAVRAYWEARTTYEALLTHVCTRTGAQNHQDAVLRLRLRPYYTPGHPLRGRRHRLWRKKQDALVTMLDKA